MSAPTEHPTDPSTQAARDPSKPSPPLREVLESAWFLSKRQWDSSLWDFLGTSLASSLAFVAPLLVFVALLLPLSTLSQPLDGLSLLLERMNSVSFVAGVIGLLFASSALWLAIDSVLAAGIYGRLSEDVGAAGQAPNRPEASFWSNAREHFATMLAWNALRWLFVAVSSGMLLLLALHPLAAELLAFLQDEPLQASTWIWMAGALALVVVLSLMFALLSMSFMPKLLRSSEKDGFWNTLANASIDLGEQLGRYVRLAGGLALIVSPIFIVYVAFSLMSMLLASQAELATLALLLRLLLDVALAVALSWMRVFVGAAFVVQARVLESPNIILPHRRPRTSWQRRPLGLGEALPMPGAGGAAAMVLMPMPSSYPSILRISELFPHLGLGEPAAQPGPREPAAQPGPADRDEAAAAPLLPVDETEAGSADSSQSSGDDHSSGTEQGR